MSSCIKAETKGRTSSGYAMANYKGTRTTAHRIAWIKVHGPIPNNMHICHKCDNRECVNVDHLFLGTRQDNIQDCVNKGRFAIKSQEGDKNPNARPDLIYRYREVQEDRHKGLTFSQLREKYNIKSNGHLVKILRKAV